LSPETKAKLSASLRAAWKRPKSRKNLLAGVRDPARCKKISNGMKAAWARGGSVKRIEAMRKAQEEEAR
jgi:hypothetical protein